MIKLVLKSSEMSLDRRLFVTNAPNLSRLNPNRCNHSKSTLMSSDVSTFSQTRSKQTEFIVNRHALHHLCLLLSLIVLHCSNNVSIALKSPLIANLFQFAPYAFITNRPKLARHVSKFASHALNFSQLVQNVSNLPPISTILNKCPVTFQNSSQILIADQRTLLLMPTILFHRHQIIPASLQMSELNATCIKSSQIRFRCFKTPSYRIRDVSYAFTLINCLQSSSNDSEPSQNALELIAIRLQLTHNAPQLILSYLRYHSMSPLSTLIATWPRRLPFVFNHHHPT